MKGPLVPSPAEERGRCGVMVSQADVPPRGTPKGGKRMRASLAVVAMFVLGTATRAAEPKPFPGKASRWNGFTRHDFQVDGADVLVVEPDRPLPSRP
jgi:hypothetical protein